MLCYLSEALGGNKGYPSSVQVTQAFITGPTLEH